MRAPAVPVLPLSILLSMLLLSMLLSACAAAKPHPLLQENPQAMSNAGLLRYYYDLGEAISACEDDTGDEPRVGVGGHTGTGGSGVGVGLEIPVGHGCDSTDLRERRSEVRVLLNQRGMTP